MVDSPVEQPRVWSSRAMLVWTLGVIAVAVAVYWPALEVRYFADDYLQIAKVEGQLGPHAPWELYSFFVDDPAAVAEHIERGSLPWWTVDDFRFVHVRPLASLLIELDHTLSPRGARLAHLHSLGWLALCLTAAAALLRRITSPAIAAVALLLFAVDQSVAWTVAWIANRCALVTATFVFVALVVHLRRVQRDSPRLTVLEFSAWALAFSAGEYAACGLAYLAAYTVVGRTGPLRSRIKVLAPAAVALLGFAVVYIAWSAGVAGGTSYLDPFGNPGGMLEHIAERSARSVGEVWLSIPADTERLWNRYYDTPLPKMFVIWNQWRDTASLDQAHARLSFAAVAVLIVPLWVLARRTATVAERRTVAWVTLGSVLSVLPLSATLPASRTLALAGLGPAVLLATVAVGCVRAWRQPKGGLLDWGRALGCTLLIVPLLLQHSALDAKWSRKDIERISGTSELLEGYFLTDATRDLQLSERHVVVLAAPELLSSFYGQWIMSVAGGPVPKTWHTLAMGARRYILRRHGADSLELSALQEPLHVTVHEMLFRTPQRVLTKGDTVDAALFRATIVQELAWQGPSAVLFQFDRPLDDPSLVFLVSGPDGLEPFTLPESGHAVALPVPKIPGGDQLRDPS